MNLHFKSFGAGEPLVILHGLFGTLDNWQTVARQLAEYYTVFIVDQRNHGKSPHAEEMNYEAMAEDIKHFLDEHWIFENLRLLGHSMGGKTAMQFALEYPDLIHKLVIVDIAPKAYAGGHEDILAALNALDLDRVETRQEAQAELEKTILEPGTVQFLMKNLSRKPEGGYSWKMNLPALTRQYDKLVGNIRLQGQLDRPTLFIRGGQSRYIQDSDWPQIRRIFPQAVLETIPDAGHWVHADAPEALVHTLVQFLEH